MRYVQVKNDEIVANSGTQFEVVYQGVAHPAQIWSQWSDSDLAAIGCYKIDAPIPLHDPVTQAVSSELSLVSGVPVMSWSVLDRPARNVSEITKLQLRAELIERGLWSDFRSYLATDADAEEEFTLASSLSITHPTALVMATAFSIDLQELFNSAGAR